MFLRDFLQDTCLFKGRLKYAFHLRRIDSNLKLFIISPSFLFELNHNIDGTYYAMPKMWIK